MQDVVRDKILYGGQEFTEFPLLLGRVTQLKNSLELVRHGENAQIIVRFQKKTKPRHKRRCYTDINAGRPQRGRRTTLSSRFVAFSHV